MKAFEIASSKDLMGKLLLKQDFDGFLLEELELVMSRTYCIDGRIRKEFFGKSKACVIMPVDDDFCFRIALFHRCFHRFFDHLR